MPKAAGGEAVRLSRLFTYSHAKPHMPALLAPPVRIPSFMGITNSLAQLWG